MGDERRRPATTGDDLGDGATAGDGGRRWATISDGATVQATVQATVAWFDHLPEGDTGAEDEAATRGGQGR